MFGFDLGKMLSGEGKGMGGMFGGSILNMVKSQLSSPKTRKMITTKVVEMAEHLASSFTKEEHDSLTKKYENGVNDLKEQYNKLTQEITKKYGDSPNEEQTVEIQNKIKELYAKTQDEMKVLREKTESLMKESVITKNDISIHSFLKIVPVKNDKDQYVMVESKNGVMTKQSEDAIFIEIHAKGIKKQTLQLDEFLANMLEQVADEK